MDTTTIHFAVLPHNFCTDSSQNTSEYSTTASQTLILSTLVLLADSRLRLMIWSLNRIKRLDRQYTSSDTTCELFIRPKNHSYHIYNVFKWKTEQITCYKVGYPFGTSFIVTGGLRVFTYPLFVRLVQFGCRQEDGSHFLLKIQELKVKIVIIRVLRPRYLFCEVMVKTLLNTTIFIYVTF